MLPELCLRVVSGDKMKFPNFYSVFFIMLACAMYGLISLLYILHIPHSLWTVWFSFMILVLSISLIISAHHRTVSISPGHCLENEAIFTSAMRYAIRSVFVCHSVCVQPHAKSYACIFMKCLSHIAGGKPSGPALELPLSLSMDDITSDCATAVLTCVCYV